MWYSSQIKCFYYGIINMKIVQPFFYLEEQEGKLLTGSKKVAWKLGL